MIAALLASQLFLSKLSPEHSAQILYHVYHGDVEIGLRKYLTAAKEEGEDYELLQTAAITFLEKGASDGPIETQLMCLLGAGVSLCPKLLPILEKGLRSNEIRAQLIALHFLSLLDDDQADRLFLTAMSSPFLLTRLEALFQLSKKQHPAVLEHIESLMVKLPSLLHPLFAQIAINIDTEAAALLLRRLLSDVDLATRAEAILAVAHHKRDEFLPQIRRLAAQTQFIQQECAAFALGELKDRTSLPLLRELRKSKQLPVRQAAAIACVKLEEKEAISHLLQEEPDLFTFSLLGEIGTEECLNRLMRYVREGSKEERLNALVGLLRERDKRALPYLKEILLSSKQDLGFIRQPSPGGTMHVWKILPSVSHKEAIYPRALLETEQLRKEVLLASLEIDESVFLELATLLFSEEIKELVPIACELLSNLRSPEAKRILQKQLNHPLEFIKAYANLTLYKMGLEGPYERELIRWVRKREKTLLISFREEVNPERASQRTLSPDEESLLLLGSFEALAASQNPAGLAALLHAIAEGNVQNRYALAGLLIRTTE